MDWFDGDSGGRDNHGLDAGGEWNWVNVGCIAFFVLLAVIMFTVLGWARDLLF
ncbi:hypothetical protein [Streptomyces roseicoloratus]|uniref:Uncharacterized protein n=1 Tax=Streptomyces roseicoloratus TaxID=2508722 RepID=A0ABY9S2J5_9ACTN|nr:hypothetical protein [Streptomyces roseicoloratus]WMX48133.1 hypothetical protein RGF97_29635 [Streptomyces roseicoloratus]